MQNLTQAQIDNLTQAQIEKYNETYVDKMRQNVQQIKNIITSRKLQH